MGLPFLCKDMVMDSWKLYLYSYGLQIRVSVGTIESIPDFRLLQFNTFLITNRAIYLLGVPGKRLEVNLPEQ